MCSWNGEAVHLKHAQGGEVKRGVILGISLMKFIKENSAILHNECLEACLEF